MIKQTPTQHCHRVTQLNSQTSPQKDRFRNILVGQVQILQHCMEILLIYYNHITYVAHKCSKEGLNLHLLQLSSILGFHETGSVAQTLSLLHFLVVPEATLPHFFFKCRLLKSTLTVLCKSLNPSLISLHFVKMGNRCCNLLKCGNAA